MRHPRSSLRLAILTVVFFAGCQQGETGHLNLAWTNTPDRPWPGPDFWPNRIQDWEVRDGRLWSSSPLPMRTVHLLTGSSNPAGGDLRISLTLGLASTEYPDTQGETDRGGPRGLGLLLGAGGGDLDYRQTALIHHSPGPGGGLFLAVSEGGRLVVADFSQENQILGESDTTLEATDSLEMEIRVSSADGESVPTSGYHLSMEARPLGGSGAPVTLNISGVQAHRLQGGLALVSNMSSEEGPGGWFSRLQVDGAGVEVHSERKLGPVLGAQHVLSRTTLNLTAQLFPISPMRPGPGEASADTVVLEFERDGGWGTRIVAPVVVPGYTATFNVEGWDPTTSVRYRLTPLNEENPSAYEGTIRPVPPEEEDFVVAAFTGNHNVASPGVDRGAFQWDRDLWFPHDDIVSHVRNQDPDFLFFSGDQVYEGASPTRADFEQPYQDYLYKWYLWLWAFRDLTGEIPSVAVPDDHDVFHGNVWGAGGILTPPGLAGAEAQDQGGYKLPADWVNMVQRTQTSHLPPPWDPAPSREGIGAYYTDILYGGMSFAVLEDRKYKSPPKALLPEADVWNGWAQNPDFHAPSQADAPGASLLGSTQEEFLEEWAHDWADGVWMKVVLSQTIFGNVATIPADAMSGSVIPSLPIPEPDAYVDGDKMAADMDSNGWPQSGRDRAVRAMRKGFAVHLAGDQHLASTIQYGLDDFGDGPFALCVPSVANFWPRRWYPPVPGGRRAPTSPPYSGDFLDGFGNPMTVFAVSNPAKWGREPSNLHERAPGYGIARFNRSSREVVLEAWPRWADPTSGGEPYPGWPVQFHQADGFGKEAYGFLPTMNVTGMETPVVQVISEAGGEVLYTIRIQGDSFTPKVFAPGSYSVRIGEPGTEWLQTFLGLTPEAEAGREIQVDLSHGSP